MRPKLDSQLLPLQTILTRTLGNFEYKRNVQLNATGAERVLSCCDNLDPSRCFPSVSAELRQWIHAAAQQSLQAAAGGDRRSRPQRPLLEASSTGTPQGRQGHLYPCRNCHKVFHYHYSMARHRRQCEGAYHLTCHVCGLMFHRRDRYNTHLRVRHNTVPPSVSSRPRMYILPEDVEETELGREPEGETQHSPSA
ncbi:hypothetical protein BaRGS_00027459 [Batillaria attramentaria]|uniref:C2H2-type domain-containing protein n=1 Tax=Batillaria attramentaria TaxID=370345 RepID=A0ABD0K2C0_9CAEN